MKRSRVRRWILSVILVFFCMLASLAVILFVAVHNMYRSSSYVDEAVLITEVETEESEESESASAETEELPEILSSDKVYNLLLIAVDARAQTGEESSGTCLLLSVNEEKGLRCMVTIPRDILVRVPDLGEKRMDRVYALGGGVTAAAAVTESFRIQVDRYLAINFENLSDIVDTVGGISLTMSESEVTAANEIIKELCAEKSMDASAHLLSGSGTLTCDGIAALAYSRIADGTAEEDYQAVRQRQVLTSLINTFGSLGMMNRYAAVQEVFSSLQHNIPESEMWSLLGRISAIAGYTETQIEAPLDSMGEKKTIGSLTILNPDWSVAAAYVQGTLY